MGTSVGASERPTAGKCRSGSTGWLSRGGDLRRLVEIDLEIHAIVVVPILLTIDVVANADKESLVLKVGLVIQFDFERESIGPVMGMLASTIVAENCTHF